MAPFNSAATLFSLFCCKLNASCEEGIVICDLLSDVILKVPFSVTFSEA